MKKQFGKFNLVLSSMTDVREQFVRVQKVIQKNCACYRIFSSGPKKSTETIFFWKKANFPQKKDSAYSSSYYRSWQASGNLFKTPQDSLAIIVQVIAAIF